MRVDRPQPRPGWHTRDVDGLDDVQRLAAYGVAVDGGRILLARASSLSDFPGTWSLPGGGVDHGEHPVDTVVRELLEETGLAVRVDGGPAVFSDTLDIAARRLRLHSVRLCYPVTVLGGDLRDEPDGTTDVAAWFDLSEALDLPAIAPFVTATLRLAATSGR